MLSALYRFIVASAVLLLVSSGSHATSITTALKPATSAKDLTATCEFRTINYITDSLPRLCLKSSWSDGNGIQTKSAGAEDATAVDGQVMEVTTSLSSHTSTGYQSHLQGTAGSETFHPRGSVISVPTASLNISATGSESSAASATDTEGELSETSFLSFEDWKKQTLEKAGQPNANIVNRKSSGGLESKKRDMESIHNQLDSLGDEGEIDIDFGSFRTKGSGDEASRESKPVEHDVGQDRNDADRDGRQYRSKDAGKTCKERFSYASFDAGATILKTHPGAKNPKAVLIENKDSYMLSECASENKFLIVELSEDIWIDTLVLANYEFFSSMIRTFRVSVSDRYPVKIDKWKDLGTYEARNSREIQAFLIENPQIWARYLRIEFLSHYGNEYYCPVSLVRVHGTRMLESWKETEASADDEDLEDHNSYRRDVDDHFVPDAVADVVQEQERLQAERKLGHEARDASINLVQIQPIPSVSQRTEFNRLVEHEDAEQFTSPWIKNNLDTSKFMGAGQEQDICRLEETLEIRPASPEADGPELVQRIFDSSHFSAANLDHTSTTGPTTWPTVSATSQSDGHSLTSNTSTQEYLSTSLDAQNMIKSAWDVQEPVSASISSTPSKYSNGTTQLKNKTTSTASASASLPTIQESFFKAVSRRLQLLEANSTLSLKYIEEQSKILREAFTKVEKKQLQKSTTFLENLNSTVLAELRGFRQQYDEIWQSTVISLESQREESRREILAISTRLGILADEVVFQKRMSIVQSILLLLCLGLVIFSRVSAGGHLDFPSIQNRARNPSGFPVESPPESPEFHSTHSRRGNAIWLDAEHRRRRSDESAMSRSRSEDDSPPTPYSAYSRSDNGKNSQSGAVEEHVGGRYAHRNQDLYTHTPTLHVDSSWIAEQQIGVADVSHQMPSPPPEMENRTFNIARKPLPALPADGD